MKHRKRGMCPVSALVCARWERFASEVTLFAAALVEPRFVRVLNHVGPQGVDDKQQCRNGRAALMTYTGGMRIAGTCIGRSQG